MAQKLYPRRQSRASPRRPWNVQGLGSLNLVSLLFVACHGKGTTMAKVLPYLLLFPQISPGLLAVIYSDKTVSLPLGNSCIYVYPRTDMSYNFIFSLQATKHIYSFQSNGEHY